MTKPTYTLEQMRARHKQLAKRAAEQEASIVRQWKELIAPPVVESQFQLWVNRAEAAYSAYDGLMTGYKLLRRYGHFFKRKKPK